MLKMSEATKKLISDILPNVDLETVKINDLLNMLDDLMSDSLGEDYTPTAKTKAIECAYDEIYMCN